MQPQKPNNPRDSSMCQFQS